MPVPTLHGPGLLLNLPPQHRQEAPAQLTDTLTICYPLLTVQEVPADPGWILLGAQGRLNALDEVAEVV